jgi:hypothetical protein
MRITIFAYNGGHHIGYGIKSFHSPWIVQNARQIVVDAQLMIIFGMW